MKLLLCSPIPTLDPKLGASRVVLDFAEAWRANGWECDLFPPRELEISHANYPKVLASYLEKTADQYDVVDFPYNIDPWIAIRHDKTVKVARSVLLSEHVIYQPDPDGTSPKRRIISYFFHPLRSIKRGKNKNQSRKNRIFNLMHADAINVGNSADQDCLVRMGIPYDKIIVLPYGLVEKHAENLRKLPLQRPEAPVVAFLGTFDYRKGCLDFPALIAACRSSCPDVMFRLIGTRGRCVTKEDVLNEFPADLRDSIEVVPEFDPHKLPNLLQDCHAGVFPSYREGFGIGVVEMLAAGLPVIAYDAPGPCDILPVEWLVERGDVGKLAAKLTSMIQRRSRDKTADRERAREISRRFDWLKIADSTHDIYATMVEAKR